MVYGLFGYAWMKSIFDPQPGFHLSQVTVIILMAWLVLCMTPAIGNIANVAHVVGLVVGAAFGYLPILVEKVTRMLKTEPIERETQCLSRP